MQINYGNDGLREKDMSASLAMVKDTGCSLAGGLPTKAVQLSDQQAQLCCGSHPLILDVLAAEDGVPMFQNECTGIHFHLVGKRTQDGLDGPEGLGALNAIGICVHNQVVLGKEREGKIRSHIQLLD